MEKKVRLAPGSEPATENNFMAQADSRPAVCPPELPDEEYMQLALTEAEKAEALGETPVGCVIVWQGRVIGRGYNRRAADHSVLAHAELLAMAEAADFLQDWRLDEATLYVTLEPCPMCAGAIVQARVRRLVYGTANLKAGSAGTIVDLMNVPAFNHQVIVRAGVLREECTVLLKRFFQNLRREKAQVYPPRELPAEFFSASAKELAPKLIGKLLCRRLANGEVLRRRITETECYYGEKDTACHAHKGRTARTEVMYQAGGVAYVYLCYGIHYLLNVVTGPADFPEAVLIRGVEGYDGPGKLTKAMQIGKAQNGQTLSATGELWLEEDGAKVKVSRHRRIGISYASQRDQERKWRFKKEE